MHQHVTHPPFEEPTPTLLDNISDTLLNAFTKVRKPDERFLEMREELDKFEEALGGVDRIEARSKSRTNDLSADYDSLSAAIQNLAHLESGITEPLTKFEGSLFDFSTTLRKVAESTIEPFLDHLTSLFSYSASFKAVLKLRDQKQLDFEELSAYLSNLSVERDRLASGMGARPGIGSYLKSRVDALRGADNDFGRESRIVKLEAKIKEVCQNLASRLKVSSVLMLFLSFFWTAPRRRQYSPRDIRILQRSCHSRACYLPANQEAGDEGALRCLCRRADQLLPQGWYLLRSNKLALTEHGTDVSLLLLFKLPGHGRF